MVEQLPSADARADVETVFAAVDRQDAAAFAAAFAPDGVFVFGNAEPVTGRAAIAAAVSAFFDSVRGLQHEIVDVWQAGDTVVTRLMVTYARHDGTDVTLPAATIWRGRHGAIGDYRIYADLGPLFVGSD